MINNLFRTYKKIIIVILVLLSAAMFLFYSCHRNNHVEENTIKWEKVTEKRTNSSVYRFETDELEGTVTFGASGLIPRDKQIPVLLQVSCKKDSFIGVMKITLPGQSGSGIDYQAAVTCIRGVITRVDLQVPFLGNPSCFGFAIHDSFGQQEISRPVIPDWALQGKTLSEAAEQGDYLYIGVVSDRPEKLSYLEGLECSVEGGSKKLRAVFYSVEKVPRRTEELSTLTAILFDASNTSRLDEVQKNCLSEYVTGQGGILILALGKHQENVLSGMKNLLGDLRVESRNSGLTFTDRSINSEDINLTLSDFGADEDGLWKEQGFSSPETCWTRQEGNGSVSLVGFSFQDGVFLQWASRDRVCADLLGRLLEKSISREEENSLSLWYLQKTLYAFLHSQMPNTFFYSCLFLLYLLLLVIFSYYYLRRRKRREWIWGVVPLLSIIFTAFLAIRSLGIAGNEGSTYSAIRIADTSQSEDNIYFLYQNGEKEEADVNFLPAVRNVVPLDYSYRTDSTGEDNLICSSKVLTVNHTKTGYSVLFDEQIPGSSRLLQLLALPSGQTMKQDRFVFGADFHPGDAAFSGTIRNNSGMDFSTLIFIRGSQYAIKKNVSAGNMAEIREEDVKCYSASIPAEFPDGGTGVVENLFLYVQQMFMKNEEGKDQVILVGITDEDDFDLFSDNNKLKNHITLFVNHFEMPGKEDTIRLSNINGTALQEAGGVSSLTEDYLDSDWIEARYAFDRNKLVWSMTREKDHFKGTIYAYNYEKEQREKILEKAGDSLDCEQLEPYLSELNVMRLTYQLPSGVKQDASPLISAELKKLKKEENHAGISESDNTER